MKVFPGKRVLTVLVAVAALLCLPLAAMANTVYSGSLTSPTASGITATANTDWDNGGFTIAWNIVADGTYNGFQNYDYTYTVTVSGPATKDLSHLILQVSSGAVAADFRGASPAFASGDPQSYDATSNGNSNPNMPASIYGLKFAPAKTEVGATDVYTIHFDSIRSPVWGNFYAKDGTEKIGGVHFDVTAWNTGLAGGDFFIGVPDTGVHPVPLPPSVLLMGSGLLGLGLVGWRRRQ
jgi:hypothetical protein